MQMQCTHHFKNSQASKNVSKNMHNLLKMECIIVPLVFMQMNNGKRMLNTFQVWADP